MRKEEIKQAALTLFANNGFEGTSLADIAGVVGRRNNPSILILKIKMICFYPL